MSTGKIVPVKGYDRLARVQKRLVDSGYKTHVYILGEGKDRKEIEKYTEENSISDSFTFLGFQNNPYRYVARADLFVCSSRREGFSTSTTEALVVGIPVCTVEVSGMKEMLGENNEYGLITENNEEALYEGIKKLMDDPDMLMRYRNLAMEKGKLFSIDESVRRVEQMLTSI